jgi:hypothetical protein
VLRLHAGNWNGQRPRGRLLLPHKPRGRQYRAFVRQKIAELGNSVTRIRYMDIAFLQQLSLFWASSGKILISVLFGG